MLLPRLWWRTIQHLNHRGHIYVWGNLLWLLLSLLIVTAPAAWGGLSTLTYRAYTTRHASLEDFWEGFRESLKPGLWLLGGTAIILMINVSNLIQYASETALVYVVMQWVWLFAISLWFVLMAYFWTLRSLMTDKSIGAGLKNAIIFAARYPLLTLGLWLSLVPLYGLSLAFPPILLLLTGSVTMILLTVTVHDRLQDAESLITTKVHIHG